MPNLADLSIYDLVEMSFAERASDLMLKVGGKPSIRQHSLVRPLHDDFPILTDAEIKRLLRPILTEKQLQTFEETFEMDLGFEVANKCRVRVNMYHQRGTWAAVMRLIPLEILSIEQLGLPPVLNELTKHRLGLILVTGPTGSGKTTSLASMIDVINSTRACHIVTVEDPLEFVHKDKMGYVSQREVHIDTLEFQPALRAVVREAPDVILIGEMRDVSTFNVAMQAGETGHLVFSTVHTASAYETMDRIVNMFPPHEKMYICQRLGGALRAIIAQKLVPRADGNGRVVANEILICTPTVTKKIEDGHFSDLYQIMNEGQFWGMQTMNQSLLRYVKAGVISEQTALSYAGLQSELKQMLRR